LLRHRSLNEKIQKEAIDDIHYDQEGLQHISRNKGGSIALKVRTKQWRVITVDSQLDCPHGMVLALRTKK
jgi:hypothetical protein